MTFSFLILFTGKRVADQRASTRIINARDVSMNKLHIILVGILLSTIKNKRFILHKHNLDFTCSIFSYNFHFSMQRRYLINILLN